MKRDLQSKQYLYTIIYYKFKLLYFKGIVIAIEKQEREI